jgi:hypothetical protein
LLQFGDFGLGGGELVFEFADLVRLIGLLLGTG